MHKRMAEILWRNSSVIFGIVLFLAFGIAAPRFFTLHSLENILVSASSVGIVATGMTFVLLTGGIDLSVGSIMYLAAVAAGFVIGELSAPVWVGILACIMVGMAAGALNALLIVRLHVLPFIVTLGTMISLRGLALFVTKSVPVRFPESVSMMGTVSVAGIPLPVVTLVIVAILAQVFLSKTRQGRQLYALGYDAPAANKAGISTGRLVASAYIVCGVCAAAGGFVSISQLGIVNAGFGTGAEFDAIASAVLGGTSLFGGVGTVLPGTVLGAVIIQMVQAGLVFTRMDLYIQPLVMAGIIFVTVYSDSLRNKILRTMQRRTIIKNK